MVNRLTNVVNCYEYDAFGNMVESKEEVYNPFRYVGEQYDMATDQYYLWQDSRTLSLQGLPKNMG